MIFRKKEISLSDQQAMNPQQIISDVTTALRDDVLTLELSATLTCKDGTA